MKLFQDKEFNRQILSLVLPISIQQLMLNLVGVSDTVMLGRVGQNALSAASLAGYVQFVFSLILTAVSIGAGMFAAQYWGKGDTMNAEKILALALRIAVPVGLEFTVLTAVIPTPLMRLFTGDETLIRLGAAYLRAVSPSYVLCGISQIFLCLMKNCGMAKKSMRISAYSVASNIMLNAALIFGLCGCPRLEIRGAALATVAARLLECVCAVIGLRCTGVLRLRREYLREGMQTPHGDFWKYTLPVLANELVWGLGFTMSTVIMGHLGSDAAAANAIANTAKNLAVCVCAGTAAGGGILVGNTLGAGALDKAKAYGGKLCRLSILGGIVAGALILISAPVIVRHVDLTAQAKNYLRGMLLISACYMIGKSFNSATVAGIFCAGGDARFGLICDTVVMWGIIVPLGLLAAFVLRQSVPWVYFILSLDEFLKLPAVRRHYEKYKWLRNLTQQA
ncbi:MAG: MATE family efflux transporter [Clostridia bacterium]|nr:MATE family efflux transporter [Clostridia bacterium]